MLISFGDWALLRSCYGYSGAQAALWGYIMGDPLWTCYQCHHTWALKISLGTDPRHHCSSQELQPPAYSNNSRNDLQQMKTKLSLTVLSPGGVIPKKAKALAIAIHSLQCPMQQMHSSQEWHRSIEQAYQTAWSRTEG